MAQEPIRLLVTLPLPPACLQTNRATGRHWATLSPRRKKYRYDARLAAKGAMAGAGIRKPPKLKAATLQATFYFPTKRRRDKDNALNSIKNGLDGIADVGVVRNDADFDYLPVKIVAPVPTRDARVEIVIEEARHAE